MDLSFSSLMAGIFFGLIGLYVFRFGKKNTNVKHIGLGMALMIYPYFISSPLANWLVGVILCVIVYLTR